MSLPTISYDAFINSKPFKKELDNMEKMADISFKRISKFSENMAFDFPELPTFEAPVIAANVVFPENIGEQFFVPLQALALGMVAAFEPLTSTLQSINEQLVILNNSALQSSSGIGQVFSTVASGVDSGVAFAANIVTIGAAWNDTATAQILANIGTTAWNAICAAGTAITTAFGAAMAFLTSPITLVVLAIAAIIAITVLLIKNWDTVVEFFKNAGAAISDGFIKGVSAIGDFFTNLFTGIIDSVKSIFGIHSPSTVFADIGTFIVEGLINGITSLIETIVSIFTGLIGSIQEIFSVVGTWFYNNVIQPIAGFFTGLWTGITSGINGFFEIFSSVFHSLIEVAKKPINQIIGFINGMITAVAMGINTIIGALNSIKIEIPDWVPGLGGMTFGFSLPLLSPPQIPLLARGGIIDQPTLALIGERGREAVMPLENNTAWITDLANQIGSVIAAQNIMSGANRQGSGGGTVNLYLDGRKFAEAAIDDFSSVANRRGISVLARA